MLCQIKNNYVVDAAGCHEHHEFWENIVKVGEPRIAKVHLSFRRLPKENEFFKQETPVCLEMERYTPNLSEYGFVVFTGKLRLVENHEERKIAIEKIT